MDKTYFRFTCFSENKKGALTPFLFQCISKYFYFLLIFAWAAANLAIGTLNGEQLT